MNKKENNEKILKSIIIMRHGERIDCIDSQKNNQLLSEYDPELTEKGIRQAIDIGNQIKKSIKKEINTINVYSSPFTRTLMTGLNLVKKLNLKKNNIFITNSLFEIASENNFKYFPLKSLLINNKNKNLYEKFILNSIKSIDNCTLKKYKEDENIIKYPETFNEAIERYNKIAEELYEMNKELLNKEETKNELKKYYDLKLLFSIIQEVLKSIIDDLSEIVNSNSIYKNTTCNILVSIGEKSKAMYKELKGNTWQEYVPSKGYDDKAYLNIEKIRNESGDVFYTLIDAKDLAYSIKKYIEDDKYNVTNINNSITNSDNVNISNNSKGNNINGHKDNFLSRIIKLIKYIFRDK